METDSKVNEPPGKEAPRPNPPNDAGPDLSRKSLGKFELKKKLGAGGMGWVYLAYDTESRRNVALKVLPRSKASNPLLIKRFKSEAEAAAQLNHPSIIRIYEAGEVEGYLYISLEYFKGTDVYQLVTRLKTLPVQRTIDMVRQVLRALDHAFDKAIVHRDIKPSNLLVSRDGTVKLTDMGLARSVDETADGGITRAGTTVGTVDYMAPEQARDSRAADVRSDIYSLACTWYHMLTGEPPFPGGTLTNKLFAHVGAPRPDPRLKNPAVPQEVVDIMHKMMARRPKDRYATPIEVLDAMSTLSDTPSEDSMVGEEVGERTFVSTLKDAVSYETGADFPVSGAPTSARLPVRPRYKKPPPIWSFVDTKFIVIAAVGIVLFAGLYFYWMRSSDDSIDRSPKQAVGGEKSVDSGAKDSSREPGVATPLENNGGSNAGIASTNPATAPANQTNAAPAVAPVNNHPPATPGPPVGGQGASWTVLPNWAETFFPKVTGGATGGNISLPTVVVGRDGGEPGKFPDLASALENLPSEGRVVQLVGPGPFVLQPTEISRVKTLVLRGDSSKRSVVVLGGRRDFKGNACLEMWNGFLALDRIDLVISSDSFYGDRKLAAVRVIDGNLAVRDCSCTMQGTRAMPASAFEIWGSPTQNISSIETAPRVFIDRTVVRGNPLTAISINKTSVDMLAQNSLFLTGSAPIMRTVGGPVDASDGGEPRAVGQLRTLRFVQCTAGSRVSGLEFETQPGSNWSDTWVYSHDSIFAAESGRENTTFVSLLNFPGDSQSGGGRSSAGGMHFVCDGAPFCGWTNLVNSKPDVGLKVEGANSWNRFWQVGGNPAPSTARRLLNTPIQDFAQFAPQSLDLTALYGDLGLDKAASTETRVGCNLSALNVASPELQTRAIVMAHRPLAPGSLTGVEPATETITIDLSNQDFGREISTTDWPSGTEFIITGTGDVKSNPVRVTGKSFRVRFDEVAKRHLRIEPRNIETKPNDESGGAFIYVKGGNVQIIGGNFTIPTATKKSVVRHFLKVRNGGFALVDSFVQGPLVDSPGLASLIDWSNSEANTQVLAGNYSNHGRIYGSYLTGGDATISVRSLSFGLSVEESMLIGGKTTFDVDMAAQNGSPDSMIDLRHSTISFVDQCLNTKFDPAAQRASAQLTVFAENSFFAPPTRSGGPNGTAIIAERAARDQHRLEWWGFSNGYAPEITMLFKGTGPKAGGDAFQTDWVNGWGPAHELRPLNMADDLALVSPLPKPGQIVPGSFEFSGDAKAARWTIDGYSIGAEVSTYKLPDPTAVGGEPAAKKGGDDADSRPAKPEMKAEPKRKRKYWHDKEN